MATINSLICFGGLNGKTVTFTDAGDVVNLTNHGLRPGSAIFFQNSGGALPTGLTANQLYYAKQGADQNKFLLYPTQADAIAGTNQVTFSGTGSGTTVVKSSLVFTGTDLSRYDNARVYDGLTSWNTGRAGASPYDIEVAEVGEPFSDILTAVFEVTVPSARNVITTEIGADFEAGTKGIRSAAFHGGVFPALTLGSLTLTAGYVLYNSAVTSGSLFKMTRYRDTLDGIIVMNNSGTSITVTDMGVQCRLYNNQIVNAHANLSGTGTFLRFSLCESINNLFFRWAVGVSVGTSQLGIYFVNNTITKCTAAFSAASTVRGFFYNNTSRGNTTDWPTQPTNLEGASNNAGAAGEAWVTGSGTRVTIETSDFADFTNNDFRAASSTSPQVEGGIAPYGAPLIDIAGHVRPDYMNGGAAAYDIGCFEFDHGYGPWPSSDARGLAFAGLVSGSKVKVFLTGTDTEKFSTASSGTSETWSESVSGSLTVDYVIMKAGYLPIRVTGVTVTAGPSGVQPVPVSQVVARWYQASSGLTINTNCFANTSTKKWGLTTTSTLQNLASYLLEQWVALGDTGEAYANKAFPLEANGPNSFTWLDGWEADLSTYAASITNLSRDGMRYLNSSGVMTASWCALLSAGVPAGLQVRFQQVEGAAPTNAAATGNIDQLIQIYGDATHGNFDRRGYMVAKVQEEGYDQAEVDVVAQYGALEDQLYVIALIPTANGIAAANPTVSSVTITDHGASPVTWNTKAFSITITDSGTTSGQTIMQWIRHALDTGGTFQGKNGFNWHDLIQVNGDKFKGVRGAIYGDTGAALKGVRVLRGTDAHPDFTIHTADDGSTVSTTPPAQASATILADSRVQLYNVTTATELDNVFVTGTTYANTLTSGVSVGDALRIRVCKLGYDEAEAFAVWTASGASFLVTQNSSDVYAAWGIDGSTVTEFSSDVTGHIYIDANDLDGQTTKTRLGAWYSWVLTTEIGIRHFYGAVSYLAVNAIRINVDVADILIENVNATTALRFTDLDVRLYRSDGTSIIAPTSYSIHNDYSGVPDVVETGVSGLTTSESNALMGLPGTVGILEKIARNKMITDPATGVLTVYDNDGATPLLTANIFKDAAGTTPYNGTGAERRERLV